MSRKSFNKGFVRRYRMKLVLHTVFTLNHDFVDEEEFPEEQKRIRDPLCATAESLTLARKSDLRSRAGFKSTTRPRSIPPQLWGSPTWQRRWLLPQETLGRLPGDN